MNLRPQGRPTPLRPLQTVAIALVIAATAGSALLLSVQETLTPSDGVIPWDVASPLQATVELLCLGYKFPAASPGAVKTLTISLASGLSLIVLGIAILGRGRGGQEEPVAPTAEGSQPQGHDAQTPRTRKHIAPLIASQVLLGLYLVWSFASGRWSAAPELALGGSLLLAIYYLWSFGIGNSLSPRAATIAASGVVAAMAVACVLAIWYYYGRNPVLDASFPYGNPRFLAACLIPTILLSSAMGGARVVSAVRERTPKAWIGGIPLASALALMLWTFWLTNSRGPALGLAVGLVAMAFFAIKGKARWIPVVVVVVGLTAAGLMLYKTRNVASPTGKDATLRFRLYAWDYAFSMFSESPYRGWGQGGFVLHGDSHVSQDVMRDPLPFTARMAHAHNEWLEVLADLGTIGVVLVGAGLLLTLRAGMKALDAPIPSLHRWALIGCMAGLVGLIIEECFGVGLRVSGVPTAFYTTIGLIWALSAHGTVGMATRLARSSAGRISSGVLGILGGGIVVALAMNDFAAARTTFQISAALNQGDPTLAVQLAGAENSPLNPQRALTRMFVTAQAHCLEAVRLQVRADDRAQRAIQTDPPDSRLIGMAAQDYYASDAQCTLASAHLKALLERSSDFIGHGLLNYQISTVRAHNTGAPAALLQWLDGSPETRAALQETEATIESFRRDAMAALQREMHRQPFSPQLALYAVGLLDPDVPLFAHFEILARPLRHHPVSSDYYGVLRALARDERLPATMQGLEVSAMAALRAPAEPEGTEQATLPWAPEHLRLLAVCYFIMGEHDSSHRVMEAAGPAYDGLTNDAPIGSTAYYAELADRRFYADPVHPALAMDAAKRALRMAPKSREGRGLKAAAAKRLIACYLAAGMEAEAVELLRSMAPPRTTEDDVQVELAKRYYGMCEAVAQRTPYEPGDPESEEVVASLATWIHRCLDLDHTNPSAHYLAANLAFRQREDDLVLSRLRSGIASGLSKEEVSDFIVAALRLRDDAAPLRTLWAELNPDVDIDIILAPPEPPLVGPPASAAGSGN